jgi:quercetin dioxygenase-like cupin family protein
LLDYAFSAEEVAMNFKDYRDFTGSQPEKFFKSTLFRGENLLLGLNCLEPGQAQPEHDHAGQDKFYFVLEGLGTFRVGDETRELSPGFTAWAPAGLPHGVRNESGERLVILVGIAPAPGE